MNDDDRPLIDLVRDFADRRLPITALRQQESEPRACAPEVWQEFAVELGLSGISVPEDFGGAGAPLSQALKIATELGAALAPLPFLSTAVSATATLLSCPPGTARDEALRRIATEGAIVSVASVYGTSGRVRAVADAAVCDILVAVGPTSVRLLTRDDFGVEPLAATDITRRWARVEIDSDAGAVIGANPDVTRAAWHCVQDAGLVADSAGGARELLRRTVDYVATREQFGRPVAGFQAVKHACAERWVDTEAVLSFEFRMRELFGETPLPDESWFVDECAVARAFATESYERIARECLHLHGGIGFTWEHDAHLFLKRANASRQLFEHRRWHELIDATG